MEMGWNWSDWSGDQSEKKEVCFGEMDRRKACGEEWGDDWDLEEEGIGICGCGGGGGGRGDCLVQIQCQCDRKQEEVEGRKGNGELNR